MDAEEFAELVAAEHFRLVRALAVVCGDGDMAEDAVQEALLRAWQRLEHGESFDSLRGWIATVALNEVRSAGRRSSARARAVARLTTRSRRSESALPDASDGMIAAEDAIQLHIALDALPTRQREVVVLHYLLDHDVRTVAEICCISEGAAKNALHHGRRSLAAALGEAHQPDSDKEVRRG